MPCSNLPRLPKNTRLSFSVLVNSLFIIYLYLFDQLSLNWRFSSLPYLLIITYPLAPLYPYPRLLTARTILAQMSVACNP